MERTMSVEEKIRRAEEIYSRRQERTGQRTATVTVSNDNKKDIKLLKKMIKQIIVSLLIYIVIYTIQNNNYIFSEDFLKKTDEILSYDMNFIQIYEDIKQNIEQGIQQMKTQNEGIFENVVNTTTEENVTEENTVEGNTAEENTTEDNANQNAIGGAEENIIENTSQVEDTNKEKNEEKNEEEPQLTQEEQDIANIKATTTFIKPVEGTISSRFGQREPTTSTVPKNHTGVDIATNMGTKILAATGGEVVLASEEGDYGKHLKIQTGEVSIIYAHCNNLYVRQGDQITQGQEIAEVGSTGNSTGPHLHFEIRISERKIDPEKILEL